MKCILKTISFVLLFLAGTAVIAKPEFSYKLPLPGETMGNQKLQYDTLMPVYVMANSKVKDCQNFSISNTKVTRKPYNLKTKNGAYIAGEWEELWTVKACSKNVDVPIKFILDPSGATYVISDECVQVSNSK